MLDFIRKAELWSALDDGLLKEVTGKLSYQLKTAQDLAIYRRVRDVKGKVIGEIGGGDSRILARLAEHNDCANIEKFQGADNGPTSEIKIKGVKNISAFVGEFDVALRDSSFDLLFSVSVVEHVVTPKLDLFHQDQMRILKPGGMFLHAIDLYLTGAPTTYAQERFDSYRSWLAEDPDVEPVGPVFSGPMLCTPDMATNPDNIMHSWGAISPSLIELRKVAQNVSLIVCGRKK